MAMRQTKHSTASDTPPGRLIGYARVSTDDQDLTMQTTRLLDAGVHPNNLHVDKASTLARRRPGLDLALKDAVAGDTFIVWKLDRLGRSVLDLITKIEALERRGVKFKSLTEGIDTATIVGTLLMHILGAIAQFERSLIAERTKTGIAVAKANGKVFGPKQRLVVTEAAELFRKGKTPKEVRDHFGMKSMASVYRYFDAATVRSLQEEGAKRRKRQSK